jgi:hypothetical protein
MLFRRLNISLLEYAASLARPAVASTTMGVATAYLLETGFANSLTPALQLAVAVPFGAIVFAGMTATLWALVGRPQGAETALLRIASSYVRSSKLPLPFRSRV